MKRKILLFILSTLLMSGCISSQPRFISNELFKEIGVPIFFTTPTNMKYAELGHVEIKGYNPEKMIKKLAILAKEKGGNALIKVETSQVPPNLRFAKAVVVKLTD